MLCSSGARLGGAACCEPSESDVQTFALRPIGGPIDTRRGLALPAAQIFAGHAALRSTIFASGAFFITDEIPLSRALSLL